MSFGMKYKLKKMSKGGSACSDCATGECMAHGGSVDFDDDLVNRAMSKRYADGGDVSLADFEENNFDYLDKKGGAEEFSYTAENSGDNLGSDYLEDENDDLVSRAMRSRKQRNPRPA